ncbi:conserved hypothetical protein [Clostridium neonatale]|uniref:methyltransferase domain-containing protein n=1 Tax=Clostridium neonatale TaxID=137838 RepID=UPI00291BD198|nr:methyltransferase domain-containing protein [Clostridium neonatale]CAI3633644.1 conserved hypothetical protein [Clostridium neonatale]
MSKYDFELDLDTENSLSIILKAIKPNSKVLEFGCATGRLTKYLNQQMKCQVDIVEIDKEAGARAAIYSEKSLLGDKEGDIEKYIWREKLKECKYDYIIFADVLEHLHDPEAALIKCYGLLKNNGSILLSVPNVAHNSILIDLINDEFKYNNIGLLDNTHITLFAYNSLKRMIKNTGYNTVLEKATYCNVGETEFNNNYESLTKNMSRELKKRYKGSIYQYVFEIKKQSYIENEKVEKIININKGYIYNVECYIQEENDNDFNELKSVIKPIQIGFNNIVNFDLTYFENIKTIRIDPINTNCLVQINRISGKIGEKDIQVNILGCNGVKISDSLYLFSHEDPQIFIDLKGKIDGIECNFKFLDYDSEDIKIYEEIINKYNDKISRKVFEIEEKNREIEEKNREIEEKNREIEEKNREIEEKNRKIEEKNEELEDRKREIEKKNEEIDERNKKIEEKNRKMEEKEKEIIDLNNNFFIKVKKRIFR